MIVERYDPVNLFEFVPKLQADFEPELRELDRLLEDDAILQRVKADFARRSPHSLTRGRHSTPIEVILRLFVVKRLYRWSYEATEHFVGDSLVQLFGDPYRVRQQAAAPCRSTSPRYQWRTPTGRHCEKSVLGQTQSFRI